MEKIKEYFEKLVPITDADWRVFSSKLKQERFPKKALILKKGQIENYLSFIEKGMVRLYVPGEDYDVTFGFSFENSFVSAYDSFLTRSPSTYTIETLTDTIRWKVSYSDLQTIYAETAVGNTIGRYASEDLFLKKSKRELSLLNETAEERYLKLFSERPELIEKIPNKYIASYIGITPQALSRIRRRIS